MRTINRGMIAVVAVLAVGAAVAYSGLKSLRPTSYAASGPPAADSAAAGERLRITLDPQLFQGDVRKAYEIAGRDPALLAQMHCYCGCDRTEGHKNLLDCFRDKHGSSCAICVGEAMEAEKLATQEMPVEQIRDALRARYAHGG
ncbi:MAG TPA: CYCXC family (seleno)protein [Candidatus Binataceae bacterium]